VRTGDDTRLFPYYVSMFVSGTLLVLLGIWERRDRRRESEGSHHA
jgi:hypothetical protein